MAAGSKRSAAYFLFICHHSRPTKFRNESTLSVEVESPRIADEISPCRTLSGWAGRFALGVRLGLLTTVNLARRVYSGAILDVEKEVLAEALTSAPAAARNYGTIGVI